MYLRYLSKFPWYKLALYIKGHFRLGDLQQTRISWIICREILAFGFILMVLRISNRTEQPLSSGHNIQGFCARALFRVSMPLSVCSLRYVILTVAPHLAFFEVLTGSFSRFLMVQDYWNSVESSIWRITKVFCWTVNTIWALVRPELSHFVCPAWERERERTFFNGQLSVIESIFSMSLMNLSLWLLG